MVGNGHLLRSFYLGTDVANKVVQERNNWKNMDAVEQISMVEHIRKRLGMYWLTRDGIPDASVWMFFLDQLANEMGAAFMRGEASYVDIRYDSGSKTMSIECDGRAATDDLCGICKGEVPSLLGGDHDLGGVDYAMITALSRRMEIEICKDGEWSAVQSVEGHVGGIERMFPEIMGAANRVRVSFAPSPQFYRSEGCVDAPQLPGKLCVPDEIDEVWSDEALNGLANGLAARCPGLIVSYNGRKYVYKNGVQGLVEELLEPLGGGTVICPRSVTYGNMSFACGAARRDDSIRRVFGRLYLNGREVKNQNVMGRIMEIAANLLVDNTGLFASGFDFVFVVNAYYPDMHWNDEWRVTYNSKGWNPNYNPDSDAEKLNSQIAKCMRMAFKEYMK